MLIDRLQQQSLATGATVMVFFLDILEPLFTVPSSPFEMQLCQALDNSCGNDQHRNVPEHNP